MKKHKKEVYFIKRVRYWFFDFYKLYDYELRVKPSTDIDADTKAYVCAAEDDGESRQLLIAYNRNWIINECEDMYELDMTAFHEATEALLWELTAMAEGPKPPVDGLPQYAAHKIIRRFENLLFDKVR